MVLWAFTAQVLTGTSSRLQQTITAQTDPKPHKPTLITVKAKVDSMAIYLTYKDRLHETTEIREVEKS